VLGYVFLHLVAMAICIAWSYPWFWGLADLWAYKSSKPDPTDHHPPTFIDVAFEWSFKIMWSTGACGAIGAALYGFFVVLVSLMTVMQSFVMLVTKYIRLYLGLEAADVEGANDTRQNLFSRFASVLPRRPSEMPHFFTTRTFSIFTNCILVIGYIIIHALGLFLCISWSVIWLYGIIELWKSNLSEPKFSFAMLYTWSFSLLWSAGACFAVGIGCAGCFTMLLSLLRLVFQRNNGWQRLDTVDLFS